MLNKNNQLSVGEKLLLILLDLLIIIAFIYYVMTERLTIVGALLSIAMAITLILLSWTPFWGIIFKQKPI